MSASQLYGTRTPRHCIIPPFSVSLGDQAIAFAAKAGLFLDPWQCDVLRGALGMVPDPAGSRAPKWAAPQVGLLVPRQNGKGSVLEALELFHLFVLGTKLIIHSAHKFDTSQEHFLRMKNLIEANADLDKHVLSKPTANGKEAIILRNGCRLKFKARTISGSGRGFSCDLLVLDEAMLLPEQALDAMLPTLTTRLNPQVWFTSSAGTPDSTALWRVVKRGRARAPRIGYWEWGCESGADPTDKANWAESNPGLGYRLQVVSLEDDLALMGEDGFAREHMGVWDDAAAGVFPPGSWDAATDMASTISRGLTYAVAVAADRSSACIAGAGRRADGLIHVELGQKQAGTEWLTPVLLSLCKRRSAAVVIDPASPAGTLIAGLRKITVHTPTAREYAQACGSMYDLVRDKALRHLPNPELDRAVAAARKRVLAGGFAWADGKDVEVSPLVAASLAVWGHQTHGGLSVLNNVW